jgi:iron-sulfur cluster assembly protein
MPCVTAWQIGTIRARRNPPEEPVAVTLTENARQRVLNWLRTRPGIGLRVGIRRTGCSGLAYVVSVAEAVTAADVVFQQDGVQVVVDAASLPLVEGTEVDYVRQGLNEAFRFRNPQAKGECGCGESFSV